MNFTIREAHPRIMVRPDDLPALRRRAATTHAEQMQSLLKLAAAGAEVGADAEAGAGNDYAEAIWRLAFLHLLTADKSHAGIAIDALRKLLSLEVSGAYFIGARRLKALAVSYDW